MILKNSALLLLISVILYSCGGTKQATTFENAPVWVKEKPVNQGYYIGIGSAIKTQIPTEYQGNAKNSALADLSSEISVNISTNSALYQMESSFGYSEDYMSSTRTTSNEQLQGYELVDTYENETHYWVYYKLSKAAYAEAKEKQIKSITQIGLDYYKKATAAKNKNDYRNAILFYLKGLGTIKEYLSESLEVDNNGKSLLLGNELLSGLLTIINDITISPVQSEIRIKSGNSISADQLSFTVANSIHQPLSNLPIIYTIGNKPLRNNKTETDFKGQANYSIQQLNYQSTSVYFNAALDIPTLLKQTSVDPFFRRMLNKIDAPTGKTKIIIESPSFFVLSNELNMNTTLTPKIVENKAKQILAQNKFSIVDQKENADYVLEFDLNTKKFKQDGRMSYANLNGSIKLYNGNNQIIFLKPIEDIQGVQLSDQKAGLDAYNNFKEMLEQTLIPKIKQSLK